MSIEQNKATARAGSVPRCLPGFARHDRGSDRRGRQGGDALDRARGTHTGPLKGMPGTGNTVAVTGANVARLAEGKIVESWFNFDMLTLLRQLGAVPKS